MNKAKTYFLEETVFLEKDFYLLLESIISSSSKTRFVVDSGITNSIENYKKLGQNDKAYAIEGIVEYLKSKEIIDYIDTTGYLDIKNLSEFFKKTTGEKIVITQKESIFDTFKILKNIGTNLYKIEDSKLVEWVEEEVEETEAFYIKNDIYINKFDTEGIKVVFSPKFGYLKLDRNDQKSGGEGTCYPTYCNLYCKIYNKKHITYTNYKKLQRMLEIDVFNPSIVWPLDLVYCEDNFVGYVMKQVSGAKNLTELKDDGFVKYPSFADRTQICISILQSIEYLHSKGILIGDLKDDNILIKSPTEVYIIDCGSFQVDDYPCDVFTRGWTDRSYKGDELNKNLRHLEDEYYPINKLIFEILVLKNPHYSKNNTEIDYENTSTFEFPLSVEKVIDQIQTQNDYRFPWVVLSQRVREYFYYYFKDPKNRRITYIKDWLNELKLLLSSFREKGW